MSLFNYISEKEQQELNKQKEQQINSLKEKLISSGMTEYAVERELEKVFCKPDTTQNYESGSSACIIDVAFYFNEEEYSRFSKVFKVLNYVENNTNQNWILMGLLKLVEDGKVLIDEKKKEVSYNG